MIWLICLCHQLEAGCTKVRYANVHMIMSCITPLGVATTFLARRCTLSASRVAHCMQLQPEAYTECTL